MTPDRWRRVQELFYEAERLPASEQKAFLEKACEGEDSLIREVHTLLGYQDSDDIEAAVHRSAQEAIAADTLPEHINEYRVIRQLGEGGMGVVYEAEQDNPRRRVALKVIRLAAYSGKRARQLFQREAEVLGRLKHPGIATIFQSGVTSGGVPFIAMELVPGIPVDEWVQSLPPLKSLRKEDVRAQLRVFRGICDAILYAHQNGVIHRDLKPSNVFVIPGQDLSAKVLDFGLARILEHEDGDLTHTGMVQGSVPFMSPEQALGETGRIDIRTDIYALGVMLFWILTRHHPYLDKQAGLAESLRIITERPPRRFRDWFTRWDADLEAIVLKTLEKDPVQRYQSVSGLTADIDRYLEDQPILARPPNTLYLVRKLIRRNRAGFGVLIGVLVLIIAFATTTLVQSRRVRLERDRANQEAATASHVSDFMLDLFRYSNPSEAGGQLTARDLLRTGRERISSQLSDQPELRARLLDRIGDAYQVIGPMKESREAFEESLRIREAAFGKGNLESANSWAGLSITHFNEGDMRTAADAARRALEIRRKYLPPNDSRLAEPLDSLASALVPQGKLQEAEALSREAVSIDRQHPEANVGGGNSGPSGRLATLGNILRNQGRYAEAIPLLREAATRSRKTPGGLGQAAYALNELGLALLLSGNAPEAEQVYREDVELASKIFGAQHVNVAVLNTNIANCLNAQRRYQEAESMARQAMAALIKAIGTQHPQRSDMLGSLGDALEGQGRIAEAGAAFREAEAIAFKGYGAEGPRAIRAAVRLAEWQARFGNARDAAARVDVNRRNLVKAGKRDSIEWGMNERAAGYAKAATGDTAAARKSLEESRDLLKTKLGPRHWQTRQTEEALSAVGTSRAK